MSINSVVIAGHVKGQPEIRNRPNGGGRIAVLNVATKEYLRSGEREDVHRVVCTNDSYVSVIERYFKPGTFVKAAGKLRYYEQGREKRAEIVVTKWSGECNVLQRPHPVDADENLRLAVEKLRGDPDALAAVLEGRPPAGGGSKPDDGAAKKADSAPKTSESGQSGSKLSGMSGSGEAQDAGEPDWTPPAPSGRTGVPETGDEVDDEIPF